MEIVRATVKFRSPVYLAFVTPKGLSRMLLRNFNNNFMRPFQMSFLNNTVLDSFNFFLFFNLNIFVLIIFDEFSVDAQ